MLKRIRIESSDSYCQELLFHLVVHEAGGLSGYDVRLKET
jgi:hypothetical protein